MNKQIFVKWLRINTLCFIGAFIVALLLALLLPDIMRGFIGRWIKLSFTVVPLVLDPTTKKAFFTGIFVQNSISVLVFFIGSVLLAAPILMTISGVFFPLAFVTLIDRGLPFWYTIILIAIESAFFIITATFASTLGTEIFGIKPERKQLFEYWKKDITKLWYWPKQERNWKIVFKENKIEIILFVLIILTLLLFGAWFEVWMR